MRLRGASLIVTFSLLAIAASAYAECAWILWIESSPSGLVSLPIVLSSYDSMTACIREIDNYDKAARLTQKVSGRASPTRLVIPYEGKEDGYREFLCLPDTVDPRWPKGK